MPQQRPAAVVNSYDKDSNAVLPWKISEMFQHFRDKHDDNYDRSFRLSTIRDLHGLAALRTVIWPSST